MAAALPAPASGILVLLYGQEGQRPSRFAGPLLVAFFPSTVHVCVSVARCCPAHPARVDGAEPCLLCHVPTLFLEVGDWALAITVALTKSLEMKAL